MKKSKKNRSGKIQEKIKKSLLKNLWKDYRQRAGEFVEDYRRRVEEHVEDYRGRAEENGGKITKKSWQKEHMDSYRQRAEEMVEGYKEEIKVQKKKRREQINSRKEEYLARVHARREERQRLLARLSERAELLMKEEFTSKVDELIGEDKREEIREDQEKYFPGDDEDARQNRQTLYPCSKTFERQSDGCVKKIFGSSCRTEKTYG